RFGEDLSGKRFAIWGLSFKPKTDDMREAPALVLIDTLLKRGATVAAFDPEAMEEAERILFKSPEVYPQFADIGDRVALTKTNYEALEGADALVIITEWAEFRRPDLDLVKKALKLPLVFDGRNIYDPRKMTERGFEYYSIGRP
ncbi:MAG: UDP binding domain-containing protein, partial [bacterium]|nr:UDP binding domain-containing protein [bacterium]